MEDLPSKITHWMREQPMWVSLLLPVLLTMLMGWLDDITGWEVSLFIFYAFPIILAVWWSGAAAGLSISALAGVVWWLANETDHPYETQLGYAWALMNREFYFCVVVFAVIAVRNRQQADEARIRMLEERRQLEHDIVSVSEHEQQRIGQDLHDGLCQHLAAIGCAARVLTEDLQAKHVPEARDASMIEDSIQQAVLEARNLARGIFPVHVDRSGLAAALSDLARMTCRLTGVTIEVTEGVESHLEDPEASMHLYRIAQEAVANAVRHGKATRIAISLDVVNDMLVLKIDDNGSGMGHFKTGKADGMGLRTMRYRAQVLGAQLDFQDAPDGGTRVLCRLPVQHPA
jgi:signal transduction histidine kinase